VPRLGRVGRGRHRRRVAQCGVDEESVDGVRLWYRQLIRITKAAGGRSVSGALTNPGCLGDGRSFVSSSHPLRFLPLRAYAETPPTQRILRGCLMDSR
jgi:hypothetical protein